MQNVLLEIEIVKWDYI